MVSSLLPCAQFISICEELQSPRAPLARPQERVQHVRIPNNISICEKWPCQSRVRRENRLAGTPQLGDLHVESAGGDCPRPRSQCRTDRPGELHGSLLV